MSKLIPYTPKGKLKELVSSIVYLEVLGTGIALQRIYQTIIINLGSNFWVSDPYKETAGREHTATIWVNGKHERPFMLDNPGPIRMYVIGVRPGTLPYFVNVPVIETNDNALGAEHWADPDIFELRSALKECENIEKGFQLIEAYFTGRISGQDLSMLPVISYLNEAMRTSTVQEICDMLGYTRKRLRAVVLRHFGSPVKEMQGIIRFHQHLAAISKDPQQSLSSLHTFYDQAHFINDFKARTGITPSQYRSLCQQYPAISHTPNFISLPKETFLQFIAGQPD
ncbi:MAG TPA: helix-turn-helix domain-containing protein [Niastella sp.]